VLLAVLTYEVSSSRNKNGNEGREKHNFINIFLSIFLSFFFLSISMSFLASILQ